MEYSYQFTHNLVSTIQYDCIFHFALPFERLRTTRMNLIIIQEFLNGYFIAGICLEYLIDNILNSLSACVFQFVREIDEIIRIPNNLKLQFIVLKKNASHTQYIETFDMDFCKNYYHKNTLYIANPISIVSERNNIANRAIIPKTNEKTITDLFFR